MTQFWCEYRRRIVKFLKLIFQIMEKRIRNRFHLRCVKFLLWIARTHKRQRFLSESHDFPKRASYPFVDVPAVFMEADVEDRKIWKRTVNGSTTFARSNENQIKKVVILHRRGLIVKVGNRILLSKIGQEDFRHLIH